MKAETLLPTMKKYVVCLFLCVAAKNAFGQQVDSSFISLAVTNEITELVKLYNKQQKGITISGDSSINRYIPTYLSQANHSSFRLEDLHTNIVGNQISILLTITQAQSDRVLADTYSALRNIDSLRKNYVVPIYPDEESFWDDTLQPILVTAGAAAVIALFFFVKF